MTDQVTFRTTDLTRWGYGTGAFLPADVIDRSFWSIVVRLNALEHGAVGGGGKGIDYISSNGLALTVTYTDHTMDGPFTLPIAEWEDKGRWAPATIYAANDIVYYSTGVYRVRVPHTSASTFDPNASDGAGHNLYSLVLRIPAIPSRNIPDATFTPTILDANTYMRFTHPGGAIVTIPSNVFDPDTEMHFRDVSISGVGVTLNWATGVVVHVPHGYLNQSAVSGSTIFAKLIGTNEWDIGGLLGVHP